MGNGEENKNSFECSSGKWYIHQPHYWRWKVNWISMDFWRGCSFLPLWETPTLMFKNIYTHLAHLISVLTSTRKTFSSAHYFVWRIGEMWRNAFTQAVTIASKVHSFNLLCRFVFVGVLLGVGFSSSVQSFVWHVCCWEKEILWLLWGPPKSEELYPAVVLFQPSPASLVTCWQPLPGHLGAAAWGARAGFCEEGFTISHSVFTLHYMPGSWEASPCAVWGVCIQRWGWEPRVKSSSTRSPQVFENWRLRRVELPLSAICDLSSQEDLLLTLPGNREEEEEQKRGRLWR